MPPIGPEHRAPDRTTAPMPASIENVVRRRVDERGELRRVACPFPSCRRCSGAPRAGRRCRASRLTPVDGREVVEQHRHRRWRRRRRCSAARAASGVHSALVEGRRAHEHRVGAQRGRRAARGGDRCARRFAARARDEHPIARHGVRVPPPSPDRIRPRRASGASPFDAERDDAAQLRRASIARR